MTKLTDLCDHFLWAASQRMRDAHYAMMAAAIAPFGRGPTDEDVAHAKTCEATYQRESRRYELWLTRALTLWRTHPDDKRLSGDDAGMRQQDSVFAETALRH
jgi:hypothetical protein